MKRVLLMLLLALVVPLATKAEVIEIGNAENSNDFPFHTWMPAFWDEEIYPMSAFSEPCVINTISYNNQGSWGQAAPITASSLRIYMGERESLGHASESDWTPLSDLTLVYSHENVVIGSEVGWEEIVLDNPFVYELNGNLVVVVATSFDEPAWDVNTYASTFSDGNVSLVYIGWEPGVIDFPAEGGVLYSEFADIQFDVSPVASTEVISIGEDRAPTSFNPFNTMEQSSWNEEIYPASAFSSACVINSISYHHQGMMGYAAAPLVFNLNIYMGERQTATHASETDWTPLSDLTLVYSHDNVVMGEELGWNEIVLDDPFVYEKRGNLVIVVSKTCEEPYWWTCDWSSSTSNEGDVTLYASSWCCPDDYSFAEYPGTNSGFLASDYADIQINTTPLTVSCPKPQNVAVPSIMPTSATLTWTAAEGTSSWDVCITEVEAPSPESISLVTGITTTSYSFNGLNSLTNYRAYVRSNCGDGDVSAWASIGFMTSPDIGGEGTAEFPYLLYTKYDLEALTIGMANGFETLGKYFKVMHDIEDVTSPIVGDFRGDFNGNNHTITLNLEGSGDLALFTTLGYGAAIHDLTVDGFVNSTGENAAGFVASFDGDVNAINWTINNCINRATITSDSDYVGGFVGFCFGNIRISNCVNRGSVTTTGDNAGGFIGINYGSSDIVYCENRGNISSNAYAGGIMGRGEGATNCANKGSITCSDRGGGIIGELNDGSVRNCYNIGTLTLGTNSGGIAGYTIYSPVIENCYNGGVMAAANTSNCGAICGFNYGVDYSSGGIHTHSHFNYYKENTWPVAFGTDSDMIYTDNYTSFTQNGTSTVCTLAEPMQGTTDLLTALNNWIDGNEEYAPWYADTYGNNNYMPAFTEGTPPGLEITPNPFVMAPRPIGAWMQGEPITLMNTSQEDVQVTNVEFDNNYFLVDESAASMDFPFMLEGEQSQEVAIGTDRDVTMSPGIMTAQVSVTWNQTHVETAAIEVMNYTPVSPDVVELAEVVTSLPQTITQNTDVLYDNYKLPGDKTDAPDAVYQLVFTEGSLFNVQVITGSNAKLALYSEDFNGKPGPMVDNYYIGGNSVGGSDAYPLSMGGDDPITNLMVAPGIYYLVVSSTSPQFVVELSTAALPVPIAASLVAPDDDATDINAPLALQWQLGQFTSEYQLLLGTDNPPTEVLVDWTTNLAETFTVDNLLHNRIYYWRVNERNATGTTEGTVWHFTTTLNAPLELQANTAINVGDELLLHWSVPMRSLTGYNVYQDGVKINGAPVTTTEYTVTGLTYNMEGYTFTVTAVYNEGESDPSNAVVVRVGGTGTISGTVFEQDGVTGIAEATVTIIGYDEFNMRHSYVCTTNQAGVYSESVCSGKYIVFATKDGYQEEHTGSAVQVVNGSESGEVDIILNEQYYPVGTVVAQYDPDSLDPLSPNVKVYWESVDLPEPLVPGWHTYCHTGFSGGTHSDMTDHPMFGYQYPINVICWYAGAILTKVALFSDANGIIGGNYTCRIYIGGDKPEDGEMVSTLTVDLPSRVGDWVDFELQTPVSISGTETLWVTWQVNSHVSIDPIPVCGDLMSYGSWWNSCPEDPNHEWSDSWKGSWMMKQYFTDRGGKAFQSYNVYRTDCYNDGPYSDENTVLLASGLIDTVYLDESWQTAGSGVYKWGVTRNYSGNRGATTRGEGENYFLEGLNAYSFGRLTGGVVPNGWITYNPMSPRTTASAIDGSLRVCAGDFASDGYVHAYTNDHKLLTFDPGTGAIVASVNVTTIMDDCAFDYSTNTMYGVANNILYSIDLTTGLSSVVGYIANGFMDLSINALACSYDGQLYGFLSVTASLFAIDKTNGDGEMIGTGYGAILADQGMSACFDHSTGRLFWVGDPYCGHVIAMVDISNGEFTIMSDGMGFQRALCIPFEYAPAPAEPESKSVWSNCLDKDMWTTVEVSVATNTGASPESTSVRFINTMEPGQGYDYVVTLDDSGYYSWDEFRKGTYNYTIEKDGYTSCGNHESIEIWEPTSLECLLEEIALQARNLYVSPTGWAMWKEGLGGDELHYDSDSYIGSVGASGSPFYWAVKFKSEQLAGFNKVNSVSVFDAPGQAYSGKFLICSTDSPLNHILYQKSITTTGSGQYVEYPLEQNVEFNNEESLWIVLYYESGADYPASGSPDTGDPNGRLLSTNGVQWDDVANYGLNYTWKIRCHVKADGGEEKQLEFYRVFLDGIFVDNTTDTHFQHDVEGFVEGETHTTKVHALYYSGVSEDATYTWTYSPCDNYVGPTTFETEDLGDVAVLNWTLPETQIPEGEWAYYDDGSCVSIVGFGGAPFYWGIMLPAGSWSGKYLSEVALYDVAAFTGDILIYQGGESAPESLVYSQRFVSTGSSKYVEYPLNGTVELDESQNLWIVIHTVSSVAYPAASSNDMGDPNGRWISTDGAVWLDMHYWYIDGTWMIRAYTTDEMPVVYNILGTMVFRDGELLTETPLPRNVQNYADIQVDPGYHEYSLRVVYDDLPIYQGDYYAMSCMETEAVTVGVDENESDGVNVYPNPVNDELTVKATDMTHLRIVNAFGQMVYDRDIAADETRVSMRGFASGVYVVHITTTNGSFANRIVVAHP